MELLGRSGFLLFGTNFPSDGVIFTVGIGADLSLGLAITGISSPIIGIAARHAN